MSEMKSVEVTITNKEGGIGTAKLLVCEECENSTFYIFVTNKGKHNHLQCSQCGVSYCDNTCSIERVDLS